MTNLNSLAAILQAIKAAYAKLENGKLTQEEIETLVENSRELYDRAVILQYKSFEEKVFGVREDSKTEIPVEISVDSVAPVNPEVIIASIADPSAHSTHSTHSTGSGTEDSGTEDSGDIDDEDEDESPAFDFSLFNDSAETVKNEALEDKAIEHISVTQTSSDDRGLHEEKVVMEQVTVTPVAIENQKFIERYSKTDQQSVSQIQMSKLDSLVGSFGLNERLQYINELFDGSSEVFADAIKAINTVATLEEALIKASMYANQFHWDNDSETVEEFVIKIKRRYA